MRDLFNELQQECEDLRQQVQDLSCQVVAYREELKTIKDYFDNPQKYGGAWPQFYSAVINKLLSSPDPGAKVKERLTKLEKVAKAAKYVIKPECHNCSGPTKHLKAGPDCFDNCTYGELRQALAALEKE